MKPFMGIDLTENKKNEQVNGNEFLVQEPSVELKDSFEKSMDGCDKTIEKSKLPLAWRIVEWTTGILAALIAGGIAKADISIAEGYKNAAWLYWIGGVCVVVFLILFVWGIKRRHDVLGAEESNINISHLDDSVDAVESELGVPSTAKETDIFLFYYRVKDGEPCVIGKTMQIAKYLNPIFKAFADSENLYLANMDGKYAFSLASIKSIRTVSKSITIQEWNKDDPIKSEAYKPYKLTTDNYGLVHCKKYHILELEHEGETWGIYYPCYENPTFEALTGLKAEEE